MIDPQHNCWWTSRKVTELRLFTNENRLITAGVSPRVLLSALAEPDYIWYSTIYGDFNDNVDIIATSDSELLQESREPYIHTGPVTKYIGDIFPVREYVLNDAVAGALNFKYSVDAESGGRMSLESPSQPLPDPVQVFVSSHDECFSYVEPATDSIIHRVVLQILELHSFYLQQDFEWSLVRDRLVAMLSLHGSVSLKSDQRRKRILVGATLVRRPWAVRIWRSLEFQRIGCIEFDDNMARMK